MPQRRGCLNKTQRFSKIYDMPIMRKDGAGKDRGSCENRVGKDGGSCENQVDKDRGSCENKVQSDVSSPLARSAGWIDSQ
jgi:hypothetical protein